MFTVAPLEEVRQAVQLEWTGVKKDIHAMIHKEMAKQLAAELVKIRDAMKEAIAELPKPEPLWVPPDAMAGNKSTAASYQSGGGLVDGERKQKFKPEKLSDKKERKNRPKKLRSHPEEKAQSERTLDEAIQEQKKRDSFRRETFFASTPRISKGAEDLGILKSGTQNQGQSRDLVVMAIEQGPDFVEGGNAPLFATEKEALLFPESQAPPAGLQGRLYNFFYSAAFEQVAGAVVMLNLLFLGYETDLALKRRENFTLTETTELAFLLFFVSELLIRIWIDGFRRFYLGEEWAWRLLDTTLVVCQIGDQVSVLWNFESGGKSHFVVRAVKMLRIFRIFRTLRMARLSTTLSSTLSSMIASLAPALCAFILFALMIYMFSVMVVQIALSVNERSIADSDTLAHWFGDLDRTILTMFQVLTGGINWNDVVVPLMMEISPLLGVVFCIYVIIGLYATMMLVVNIFSDRITKTVREDKDGAIIMEMSRIFTENSDAVTWDVFASKLKLDAMVEFFDSIDVNPSVDQAKSLFELIDVDGSGAVDNEEIVLGCLRLRGNARALDMALVLRDVALLHTNFNSLWPTINQILSVITQVSQLLNEAEQGAKKKEMEREAKRKLALSARTDDGEEEGEYEEEEPPEQ